MDTCKICGRPPANGYRRKAVVNGASVLTERCCDPCHDSYAMPGTADAKLLSHYKRSRLTHRNQ